MMRFGQFDERRRTINDAHDSDGRVLARQLFEAAAKHWINRENRDGDHECLGLLQWPTRHYFTGRSPTTTLSATGVPPRIKLRSTSATDALGTEQPHDFANAIDWLPVPGGNNIADEHSCARGRSIRIKPKTRTPRPPPKDCAPFDAGSRFTGRRLTPR